MWQDEVVVDVEQRQLMLQAVLALAQRIDPAADRGHALAQVQIEPLYKGCIGPAQGTQDTCGKKFPLTLLYDLTGL